MIPLDVTLGSMDIWVTRVRFFSRGNKFQNIACRVAELVAWIVGGIACQMNGNTILSDAGETDPAALFEE